jgi:hypothetical protein
VKQKAVAADTREVAIDSFWGDAQVSGDLAVGHAAGGAHEELGIQHGQALPVRGAEGLSTEGASAVQT